MNNSPKAFLQFVTPEFTHQDIDQRLEEGCINNIDAEFLKNILNEYIGNPEILKEVYLYRNRLNNNLKPGQDLFIKMQELGCKNHPLTGLDISGYYLPSVDLNNGTVGENLFMLDTHVRGSIWQKKMNVGGCVNQMGLIGRSIWQSGARIGEYVCQNEVKIRSGVCQSEAEIGGDVDQSEAEIGGNIYQMGVKIGGSINQKKSKIEGYIDQDGMEVKKNVCQDGMEVGRDANRAHVGWHKKGC